MQKVPVNAQKPVEKIRKATPKHFGTATAAERDALSKQLDIHAPRNLRTMVHVELCALLKGYTNVTEDQVESMLKIFKHWLMDVEHTHRMSNDPDLQDVVSRMIKLIEGEKQ